MGHFARLILPTLVLTALCFQYAVRGQSFQEDCQFCMLLSNVVRIAVTNPVAAGEPQIEGLLSFLCQALSLDASACAPLIEEIKREAYSLANFTTLEQAGLACRVLLGSGCDNVPFDQYWSVPIPGNKPPVQPVQEPVSGSPMTRILHLSDIHWELNYTVGLTNDCPQEVCCRPPHPEGAGSTAAGLWGDIHCDLPYRTLVDLMEYLASIADQFDMVYVTGDLPGRAFWTQTRESVVFELSTIADLFRQHLPGKPVYSTLGNHAGVPINSFPLPAVQGTGSLSWLLDGVSEAWSTWLSNDSLATLRYAGYYNQEVYDGLRLISLQSNYGHNLNFWSILGPDPDGQMAWLTQQLLVAEAAGDKVHIIGHVSPYQLTASFGSTYHSIVNRFESTIAGQFFGHTHRDEFQVFFDTENVTRPTSVAHIGASITPADTGHCGFKIYTADGSYTGSSHAVLDYRAFLMNVTDANLRNMTTWREVYSARDEFGMDGLSPADWTNLLLRFEQDDELFQRYYRLKFKLGPPASVCDEQCRAGIQCEHVVTRTRDPSNCISFLQDVGVTTDIGITTDMGVDGATNRKAGWAVVIALSMQAVKFFV